MKFENHKRINKILDLFVKLFYISLLILLPYTVYSLYIDKYEAYIEDKKVEIDVGELYQINLLPKNSMYFNIEDYEFKVVDNKIAKVDKYGFISGVSTGTTKVKVIFKKRLFSKSIDVNVGKVKIKELLVDNSMSILKNETSTINVSVNNTKGTRSSLEFESEDENIAIVDGFGNVTGINEGKVNIIVKTKDGIQKIVKVNVKSSDKKIENISFLETKVDIYENESKTLFIITEPSDANTKNLVWKSSNSDIVSVDSNGKIVGKKEGYSKITVTTDSGLFSEIIVNVNKRAELTLNTYKSQINVGSSIILSSSEKVKWTSSNDSIIKIDSEGKVIGLKEGKAKAIATTNNGTKKECEITVVKKETNIVSIKLDKSNVELIEGSTYNVKVTLKNVKKDELTWKSNNEKIATVDSNGKIEAKKEGKAIISVSKNNVVSNITIKVKKENIEVEDISIKEKNLVMYVGDTKKLTATIIPNDASDKKIVWESSNTSIATVNSNGKITAKKAGTVTITAKSNNGKKASSTIKIKEVIVYADSVKLDKSTITIYEGDSINIKATISPKNVSNQNITWSSNDNSVAVIDSYGKVTGKKEGSTIIIAKTNNGKEDKCTVIVRKKGIEVTDITLNYSELKLNLNDTNTLIATINPSNATNKEVTWKSSNTKVITVDSNGKIKAVGIGTSTITAKSNNGKKATCVINVPTYIKEDNYPYIYQDSTAKLEIEKKTYNSSITNKSTVYYQIHLVLSDYGRLHTSILNNRNCKKTVYKLDKNTGNEVVAGTGCGLISEDAKNIGAILALEADYSLDGGCSSLKGSIRDGEYYYVNNNRKDITTLKAGSIGVGFYSKKTGILGPASSLKSSSVAEALQTREVTDSICFGGAMLVDGENKAKQNPNERPRQANFVGYVKPGEFYFIVSEGLAYSNSNTKSDDSSYGLLSWEKAEILKDLGCSYGLPFDGGGSVIVWFRGKKLQSTKYNYNGKTQERDWLTDYVYFK